MMQFMANVLPTELARWEITSGSMTEERIMLNAGGSAEVALQVDELAYVPKAFKVRIRYDSDTDWHEPNILAVMKGRYEDGSRIHVVVPLNATGSYFEENVSENIVFVHNAPYRTFQFIIQNDSEDPINITAFELLPSIDMDSGQEQTIEALLPQIVYSYNFSAVTVQAGTEAQIIQLPVAISRATNLMAYLSVTGTCVDDTITCILKFDGTTVKAFPIQQTFVEGSFHFGIPAIIPFVTEGSHTASLHLSTASGAASVNIEDAVLILEGKAILGGASGEYPHAEVFTEILFNSVGDKWSHISQNYHVDRITPSSNPNSERITVFNYNLGDSVTISFDTE